MDYSHGSMDSDRSSRLCEFVAWAKAHVTGDEKGQAQIFLDRLFQAFGQPGSLDVGGTPEFRIRKAGEDHGGVSFADYIWKPVVLVEMKRRGTDLSRHLQQAVDYWTRATPNRPRYVVLCNFDEFRVYDFEQDINEPQDTVALADLPDRYGPLAFLFPTRETPVFRINRESVTRDAADLLATVYNSLAARHDVGPATSQRFILQMLVALFSEDIGLLPKHFVTRLLDECTDPPKAFDLLGGLFHAMATPDGTTGGRFRDVPYFNGGIFEHPSAVELDPHDEVALLRRAAAYDWSHISPDIFGTLFQHSTGAEARHAYGAHYTSQADILKIVRPTIVQPFTKAIEKADSLRALNAIRARLQSLRVLDPACGSGNFLYIAYREMRRLEVAILIRENQFSRRQVKGQTALGGVSPRQLFGMDVLPFAVELAKVTLSLAPKLAADELHTTDPALPLHNLDANIQCLDALIATPCAGRQVMPAPPYENVVRTDWPRADVIIGNPPFLGAKRLKPERGTDYVNAVRRLYPEVPGMADYCVYWIRRSHDHLDDCSPTDPFRGRAGLVGTQNIRNNQSRVGGLDHVSNSGVIVEAVDNQPWSGEANVHVSIVNWLKRQSGGPVPAVAREQLLMPTMSRLWSKAPALPTTRRAALSRKTGPRSRSSPNTRPVPKAKTYELVLTEREHLNSSLSADTDVSTRARLPCNIRPKRAFQGKVLGYDGFLLDAINAKRVSQDSRTVVRPILTGRELLDEFRIRRWVIDFGDRSLTEAAGFHTAFEHCREHVLPEVKRSVAEAESKRSDMLPARREHLNRWWQFWNRRDELNGVLNTISRYIACSRVSRRPIMVFVDSSICPSDALQVFGFDDDYSFGILQSSFHFDWFRTSSRLKVETDLRYSTRAIFETFPWPQAPTRNSVLAVAMAARDLRATRQASLQETGGGLRDLYRLLELPGESSLRTAHDNLDRAVMAAYGFRSNADILQQLLDLNHQVARNIERGQRVISPGIPAGLEDERLFSDDRLAQSTKATVEANS